MYCISSETLALLCEVFTPETRTLLCNLQNQTIDKFDHNFTNAELVLFLQ
jgi:hypothetical protein